MSKQDELRKKLQWWLFKCTIDNCRNCKEGVDNAEQWINQHYISREKVLGAIPEKSDAVKGTLRFNVIEKDEGWNAAIDTIRKNLGVEDE